MSSETTTAPHDFPRPVPSAGPGYEVRPIVPETLRELRLRDDAGRAPRVVIEGDGGTPLRCCLSRSVAGERLFLVSYAPLRRWAAETGGDPGPYDEVGPVFIHPEPCGGWPAAGQGGGGAMSYPREMWGERRVLRAYSTKGEILGGRLIEGHTGTASTASTEENDGNAKAGVSLDEALEQLYSDPRVAAVHIRAVEYGCFHAETRRVDGGA
ncbi:DUF1203 domain-containing protein [Streptomyces zagrosensis]|uniref:DUF1203 domain-containing protein n=1 Tax=Streptomyces zagrosensis TaxID=1042984 RepID=A0A7W9QDL1_9ACTN|nr:DUF1203 domain-containing protein [Streptomyces zagrosensis]MBB5937272.1 hypothetical protein [Streptomyces zagrosensis]